MTNWTAIAKAISPSAKPGDVERIVPMVEQAMTDAAMADEEMMLYALATMRVETWGGSLWPSDERPSKYTGRSFELYEPGTDAGRRLGNTEMGDGPRFRGRGLIQLTGRYNYTKVGGRIGVDLVSKPELANDPSVAAKILADFIKQREVWIRNAMWSEDYKTARKAVNAAALGLDEFTAAIEQGYKIIEGGPQDG